MFLVGGFVDPGFSVIVPVKLIELGLVDGTEGVVFESLVGFLKNAVVFVTCCVDEVVLSLARPIGYSVLGAFLRGRRCIYFWSQPLGLVVDTVAKREEEGVQTFDVNLLGNLFG